MLNMFKINNRDITNSEYWCLSSLLTLRIVISAGIYFPKDNNGNTRAICEICSKLTIKTPERCHWRSFGVLNSNFEHVLDLFLQVNVCYGKSLLRHLLTPFWKYHDIPRYNSVSFIAAHFWYDFSYAVTFDCLIFLQPGVLLW